jgi:hypothetical protein
MCAYSLVVAAHMWAAGLRSAALIRKSAALCSRRVCGALNTAESRPSACMMHVLTTFRVPSFCSGGGVGVLKEGGGALDNIGRAKGFYIERVSGTHKTPMIS